MTRAECDRCKGTGRQTLETVAFRHRIFTALAIRLLNALHPSTQAPPPGATARELLNEMLDACILEDTGEPSQPDTTSPYWRRNRATCPECAAREGHLCALDCRDLRARLTKKGASDAG